MNDISISHLQLLIVANFADIRSHLYVKCNYIFILIQSEYAYLETQWAFINMMLSRISPINCIYLYISILTRFDCVTDKIS